MTEATGTPPPAAPRGDRTGGPRGLQSRRSFVLCAAGVGIGLALDGCSSSPPPPKKIVDDDAPPVKKPAKKKAAAKPPASPAQAPQSKPQ